MSAGRNQRPYVDKVAADTRDYVLSLIEENKRLSLAVAELEVEREHTRAALNHALTELNSRDRLEGALRERMVEVESEARRFAERYVELEQQNANLANLYVAGYQLHGTKNRERVIAAIQEIVINLIGSEELAIWEMDEELDSLRLVGSFGIDARTWAGVPSGHGIVGCVIQTGEPFIANGAVVPAGSEEQLTACIPLKLDDVVIGAIGIFRLLPQKSGLEAADIELFDLLGSHAATAMYCTRCGTTGVAR